MDLTSGGVGPSTSSDDVASLLDNSDDMQLVRQAVLFENVELLADLFKVNPWVWNRVDRHGRTPLMLAAHNGKLNSLRTILMLSPKSLNLTNERGKTALHMAAESGEISTVMELVEIGSDPMKSDTEGHCALELAQMAGHNEVAAKLIDAIQKESETLNHAHIMLISACISGSADVVNEILRKNMEKKQNREIIFNGRTEEDETALLIRLMQSPMTCSSPLSVLRVALKGGISILYPECSINRNSPFVLEFIDFSSIFTENSQINKAVRGQV
ncbi:hypothetical protein B9Z55_002977 [Caenorhabditis nigoni]|uniref:Uncharacterized protein n=1 Tax=Caenorhabditis nigoni TaxID=1611254 RepID=A0A2G5VN12_9PELO|nr:hypothetical protein B9Z55_002977 [Caenorhabditis nigoni]